MNPRRRASYMVISSRHIVVVLRRTCDTSNNHWGIGSTSMGLISHIMCVLFILI